MSMKDVREEYHASSLHESDLTDNPMTLAKQWVETAIRLDLPLPNAMALSTVDASGQPSSRIVLLKDVTDEGFVFYSHYDSRKGREIEQHPQVSFVMLWPAIDQQLVVMGQARRLPVEQARAYFASRPHASQLSAAASPQSRPISQAELTQRLEQLEQQYPDGAQVPMPDTWGGFLIRPHEIQFWHGRPGRLHDRFQYLQQPDGGWIHQRLAP